MDCVSRDLPDTEETEYMVNAVGIEVFRHFSKTRLPPCETVTAHFLPVVSRQPPVLAEDREVIRWCSRLTVEVEQPWIKPCVDTCARDSDRDIAFKCYSLAVGVVLGCVHLFVEIELQVVDKINLIDIVAYQPLDFFGIVIRILAPFCVVRRIEFIAQHTECGVGFEPIFVLNYKIFEFF